MIVSRGEIWLAELDPVRGSEQMGKRPVLIIRQTSLTVLRQQFWQFQ